MVKIPCALSSLSLIGVLLLASACTQPIPAGTVGKLSAKLPVEGVITFE